MFIKIWENLLFRKLWGHLRPKGVLRDHEVKRGHFEPKGHLFQILCAQIIYVPIFIEIQKFNFL